MKSRKGTVHSKMGHRATESNSCEDYSLHAYWSRIDIEAMASVYPVCSNCIECMSILCAEWKIP